MPQPYEIVLSEKTLHALLLYKSDVENGIATAGARLKNLLPANTAEQFIEALLATKQPRIFAESEIRGDGSDWNFRELALLGDINVVMAVRVFDNGTWSPNDQNFREYATPMDACLMFTPGPLLGAGGAFRGLPPDYTEVTDNGWIDRDKYSNLIERRLLPLLMHANDTAKLDGKPALIALPGIGAGAFAGEFKGEMGAHLDAALRLMLQRHGDKLPHIGAICFDPFNEGANATADFNGITYRVRPATLNAARPQLSPPASWQEKADDFSNYRLYKIVAWDHASLPGNDFFGSSRFTDDGVAAAATDSMKSVTGIEGRYAAGGYQPPAGYKDWEDVCVKNGVRLLARGNVKVAMNDGRYVALQATSSAPSQKPPAP
ncbi:MAG: DUF4804 domain-containing protein [Micavibrio sp.]|nr:DUF4804 domain-containing protein [Micavibrio sp.]